MKIKELINILETEFKPEYTMQGDKVGLQIQSANEEVDNILIAYEINDKVIDKAIDNKVDFILAFHPLIYSSLESITESNRVGHLVTRLIQNSISLYVIHTRFDAHPKGTNYLLAERLGLNVIEVLSEYPHYSGIGMGVVASPKQPCVGRELVENVKKNVNPNIRCSSYDDIDIDKVAIVGGSGFSFISDVLNKKCSAFITADCSYHKFHEVDSKLLLIDAGHFETEQFIEEGILNLIKLQLQDNVNILVSKINTNPISYI